MGKLINIFVKGIVAIVIVALILSGIIAIGAIAATAYGTFYLVKKGLEAKRQKNNARDGRRNQRFEAETFDSILTPSQTKSVNSKLRAVFESQSHIKINEKIDIRLGSSKFKSIDDLMLFYDGEYITDLNDLSRLDAESYMKIYNEFLESHKSFEVAPEKSGSEESNSSLEGQTRAQEFIEKIKTHTEKIDSPEIAESLKKTELLLLSVRNYELQKGHVKKVDKLYDYYLPILISILGKYNYLSENDPLSSEFMQSRKKLAETVELINEALKNIISDFYSGDYIDMSADLATLQAILKKDGMVDAGKIKIPNAMETDDEEIQPQLQLGGGE